MTCSECGSEATEGQRFCGQCGSPLVAVCPSCHAENPPANRFCGSCGSTLTDRIDGEAAPSTTERRVVSVLFVDLVGFTSFSEGRDPEDVRALITEYFDVAKDAIERFGGTVDKFIGDAVMAWWGATTSNEDDAERAVRSALEVVDRVAELGDRLGIADLAARAGVMTGRAAVGPGGNEKGLLLGDMVNAASRLQSLAGPGQVFVGPTTAELVASGIEVVPMGDHRVKGKDEPITAFRAVRVLSEVGGRGRADVLEPPFVGRDAELRLLKDALHATGTDGRARLVSIVGQGGIGKSRLMWEFLKYVDGISEVVYWHEGRSPAYGDGLALWALGEMVRQRAEVTETDDAATTTARLAAMIDGFMNDPGQRSWVLDRLTTLLGVGDSVGSERSELFAAARALFEAIARLGTTVLVFEDLQWADPGLLEFIEELPDWSQNHPILVVTATRPDLLDRRPDWGSGRRGFTSVYLAPLSEAQMGDLVRGVVPGLPETAVTSISAAAGGVPLFAVETVRMLLGDGRLVMRDGRATVHGDLATLEVPSSVQAVIAARLDRLPEDERELARYASVLGQSLTVEGLAALRDEDADKVEKRLAGLIRHEIFELIRDPRSPERGQYQWVQSLLREVTYGRLSRPVRHTLHLAAARYFRDLADPELDPVAAAHFVAAKESADAVDADLDAELLAALESALRRAEALHAHEQVLLLADSALSVIPADRATDIRAAALKAANRLSDEAASERHLDAILAAAESSGDHAALHRAMALAAETYNAFRRSDRTIAVVGPHLTSHPDLAADPYLTRAAVEHARAVMLTGDFSAESIATLDRALGAAEAAGLVDAVAEAMISLGTALSKDRPHQGVALIKGGIGLADRHGLMNTKLRGLTNLGYASPDVEESAAATAEAFAEAKRVGDRNHATFVAGNLFGTHMYLMQLAEAEAVLTDPSRAVTAESRVGTAANLAAIRSAQGDLEAAERFLAEARERLADVTDTQVALEVERSEAFVAFENGRPDEAFDVFSRHFRDQPFAPAIAATGATDAAILMGDPDRIRLGLDMLRGMPTSPFVDPVVARAELALRAIGGETDEVVAEADGHLAHLRSTGQRGDEFALAATMAQHLPAGPDRDRFADLARTLAREVGALGRVAMVDRIVASAT